MNKQHSFNKIRSHKESFGGFKEVYGGKADITMPTGYSMPLDAMPPVGQVIPAGTPFSADDATKVAQPHYAFAVHSPVASGGTEVQVFKGFEGTRAKVGMVIMLLSATANEVTATGVGHAISAVDATNEFFDILTLATPLTGELVQGDILVEATQVGAGALTKVIPTATSYGDIPVYGDEEVQLVDLVHVCNVIYNNRIPPIHPVFRAYMNANGYFVRFYDGE